MEILLLIIISLACLISSAYTIIIIPSPGRDASGQELFSKNLKEKIELTESLSNNQNRPEFALIKGVDPAYIVLALSEHSGVMAEAHEI